MRRLFPTLLMTSLFFVSCKKEHQTTTDNNIIGQWKWVAQYQGAPTNPLTPQNTGIEETLNLNDNNWLVTKNGNTVSSGTFRTSVETSSRGEKVNTIYYHSPNNSKDSTTYYKVFGDTLMFSNDLIGTIGSGARLYVKL